LTRWLSFQTNLFGGARLDRRSFVSLSLGSVLSAAFFGDPVIGPAARRSEGYSLRDTLQERKPQISP
jgi:hypothetical protein